MGYDFQKISKLIDDSGRTRKSFFNKIGMSEKTFASWINGSAIPKETDLRKIAERLGVSLADLRNPNHVLVAPVNPPQRNLSESSVLIPENGKENKDVLPVACVFSEEELNKYRGYSACIIFDTCAIMNNPDLLEFVNGEELVVVPKIVLHELENHKLKYGCNDAGRKAQKALSAIYNYERQYPLLLSDENTQLIPKTYRAEWPASETNDNKILSVAILHKSYTPLPVLFITDDFSLSMKASGEDIQVCSSNEFKEGVIPPFLPPKQDDLHINEPYEYAPLVRLNEAEEKGKYNNVVLYSIILRNVTMIKKHIHKQIDHPIECLAELYISLRTKKDVRTLTKIKYAELKKFVSEFFDEEDMAALDLSFIEAYKDALSSLGGSIKQIAGDLD